MNLEKSLFIFITFIAFARFLDFLIGESGRKWCREHLVFKPWFTLQQFSFHEILLNATTNFGALMRGGRFVTTAIVASFLLNQIVEPQLIHYGFHKVQEWNPDQTRYYAQQAKLIGVAWLVFYIPSWLITKELVRRIVSRRQVVFTVGLWAVDLLSLAFLVIVQSWLLEAAYKILPSDELRRPILEGGFIGFDYGTLLLAVNTSLPTIIHLAFVLMSLVLASLELMRRQASYLLERFDEADDSPLTVFAGLLGIVVVVLNAFRKLG